MITNIVSMNQYKKGRVPSAPRSGVAIWPIAQLMPKAPGAWMRDFTKGRSYEQLAASLWTHQPNLRSATEKLASYLTPMWPNQEGMSLWGSTVEKALHKVDVAVQRGEAYEARIVGIYIYWLSQCVHDLARLAVYGVTVSGQRLRWEYFEEPLNAWAKKYGITYLEAELVEEPPSDEVIAGLRTHLVARITDPVDAGYMEMYAPRG